MTPVTAVQVNLSPVLSFAAGLGRLQTRRLLRAVAITMRDQARRRIYDQDPSFPPKSKLFQAWAGGKTLFVKGNFARSIIESSATDGEVFVGSNAPQAARLQYGGLGAPGHKQGAVFWILPEYEPSPFGHAETVEGAFGVRRTKSGKLVKHHYFGESVNKDGKVRHRRQGWRIKRYPSGLPMGKLTAVGKNNDPGDGSVPVLLAVNVRPRPIFRPPDAADASQIGADIATWTEVEMARLTRANGGAIHG